MKKIELNEQKKIMIELLEYFDRICRENNIKYSLIGGSLIGAIRHKGIIPWDDDIDVILSKSEYLKLIQILENMNDSRYKLLTINNCRGYNFPFPKLVDKRTFVVEPRLLNQIKEYGIFIDIFSYSNTSNSEKIRIKDFKKIKLLNSMMSRTKLDFKNDGFKQNFLRLNKNILSKIIGYRNIIKFLNNIYNKYNNVDTDYVVSNWPVYNINKEVQKSKNIIEYTDVEFENMKIMIFKNYDEILRTTFGDYMQLPPENQRKAHGLIAYWRDNNENAKH